MCISVFLAARSGMLSTLLIKIGLKEDIPIIKDAYRSWSNCLNQLHIDVDTVFIGDSITANGDFQALIPAKKICNLGCYGDQIWDVTSRINAVKNVHPEAIYIMIGTNSLACRSLEQSMRSYSIMANNYTEAFQDCKIVFLSILPVASNAECGSRTNANIQKFNAFIQNTAKEYNAKYIDLFSLYELDGELNPDYTNDGLHITPDSYKIWIDAINAKR